MSSATIPQPGQRSVSLPVARSSGGGSIRRSRNKPRRFAVLLIVQALLIVHVAVWALSMKYGWFDGRTISPVEPSESMEFAKRGVINAGFIFFALALLSTLLFGRWFCGWGCHMLLLQDGSSWLLEKMGIRPKPFRSRLLVFVPLALALYMFVWPAFYRLAIAPWMNATETLPEWDVALHLTTTDFWRTFPGWAVAVPFLLICGFGCVYFLGSKGFCTYGCPYGGFFAPLDEFSPARIRVTDACEQCGHCTAVCTSNVRVHDEVREYGMVVDPGCFKCLDCVSVCPNDALYFGFGRPAVRKGAAKTKAPTRKYDLSLRGEVVLLVVLIVLFMCFRGNVVRLPLLLTAGVASVLTWLAWTTWRLCRQESVNLHRLRMKFKGRWQLSGRAFAVITCTVLIATLHSGLVNALYFIADWHDSRGSPPSATVYGQHRLAPDDTTLAHAARGIAWYRRASTISNGGLALTPWAQESIDTRIAWLHSVRGEWDDAIERLTRRIDQHGLSDATAANLALIYHGAGRPDQTLSIYTNAVSQLRAADRSLQAFGAWAMEHGYAAEAIRACEQRVARFGEELVTLQVLSLLYLDVGRLDDGIVLIRKTNAMLGHNPYGYRMLALALADQGNFVEAIEAMTTAMDQAPDDEQLVAELNALKRASGL